MHFNNTRFVDITLVELENLLCSQAERIIKENLGVDSFSDLGVLANDNGIHLFTLDDK